jgi:hypothetical protein
VEVALKGKSMKISLNLGQIHFANCLVLPLLSGLKEISIFPTLRKEIAQKRKPNRPSKS